MYHRRHHYSIVSAPTGCPAMMKYNNDPDITVMASVFPDDCPTSFVAKAPLTVIALAGSNNIATVAFAVATTTGTAAAAQGISAATLAALEIVNVALTHVAAMAASKATLVVMTAPSENETVSETVNAAPTHVPAMAASTAALVKLVATARLSGGTVSKRAFSYSGIANAAHTEELSEAMLVAMAVASETALNKEDIVASLLSSGAVGKNEDTTPTVSGEKTGVASSTGSLDEDTPPDSLAEQDTELHYYRSHKASFNAQAFPPGGVTTKNTKFKPKIQIDCIRNVVHTWHDYAGRAKDQTISLIRKRKLLHYSNEPTRQATSE